MKNWTVNPAFLASVFFAIGIFSSPTAYAGSAPGITTQPQSQSLLAGTNATFTVAASGQTPLSYQWSFKGTNLSNNFHVNGSTSPTLTISNIAAGDTGNYQVVVSNSHGTATSSNATLTVLIPAGIIAQPTNQTVLLGGTALFTANVIGTQPLSSQWYFNGAPLSDTVRISGSLTASLMISDVQLADAGGYVLVVSNFLKTVASSNATLTPVPVVHYVNLASSNPVPPYSSWNTAATNIQDAIDAANAGETIVVTNGIYQAGNRVVSGVTNRVVTALPLMVESVNGPAWTVIDGGGAVRCVYLTNGCSFSGFTVTNGASSQNGGGVCCASTNVIITNCMFTGNSAYIQGGGVYQGTLTDCLLTNNSAGGNAAGYPAGGGAGSSVLLRCLITGNSGGLASGGGLYNCIANQCILTNNATGANAGGGGAQTTLNNCLLVNNTGCGAGDNSMLNNCILVGNTAPLDGGGASFSTLNNCTLIANSAPIGGGVDQSTLYNCTLISNSVSLSTGGGACACTLSNCTLIANFATNYDGGGVDQSTLYNCALSGNVAGQLGGAAYRSTLYNCTLSNNIAKHTGGGAANSALYGCLLIGNIASDFSGGADSCVLVNSLIFSNTATYWGGGVGGCTLTNCVLMGNSVNNIFGFGGGANGGSLYNCLLAGNSTSYHAGGAEQSVLINCTVAGNSAGNDGGGVDSCALTNSVVYDNISPGNGNYSGTNNMSWCCTTPLPNAGVGDVIVGVSNISSAPLFVSAAAGDFRLYPGSPCIDTGNIGVVPVTADLDGNPRIVNGTVDLGAYEFQNSPFIEVQPASQTVPFGQSPITFSVVAVGPGLAYQWQFNGTNIFGATNSTFLLSSAQFNDTGVYSVLVTNSFGAILSSNAVLTVLLPPMITLQPTNQAVPQGSNVTFTTAVSGDAPLGDQWFFNGIALTDGGQFSGTATTNLTIANLQLTNMGNYVFIVTNPVGSATSSVAALTVISPPTPTAPFTNQVAMVFSNTTLSVSAAGTPPLSYQWQKNGTNLTDGGNIAGSGGPNLTISNPQLADSGQYSVIVTNAYGLLTNTAVLTVLPIYNWGNNIINPPANATNLIAIAVASFGFDNADFAVQANGSLLGWGNDFEFILDNLPGSTNFLSVTGADGNYIAITQVGTITTWGGSGAGPPANLTNVVAAEVENAAAAALLQNGTVVTWPGSPVPPANATNIIALSVGSWGLGGFLAVRQDGTVVGWGDNAWGETTPPPQATNVVAVLCGDNQSLVLRADGTIVNFGTGASTPPASATNVTAIALGTDNSLVLRQDGTVVEWGALGTAPSIITNVVAIAANGVQNMVLVQDPNLPAPPKIQQQPLGAVTRANQTLILEGQAFGALPIQYQWYFNNAPISGQTNRWLLLFPIQAAQGGNYRFIASNNFGSVTSLTAVVWTPPVITTPPVTTVAFGSNAVLGVVAAGTAPLGYQWSFNGTPLADGGVISGSATANLNISNFQPANLGNYTVTVTNIAGSATGTAVITVLNPLITTQPQSQSVYAGATVNFSVTATGQSPFAYQWVFNDTNLPGATGDPLVLTNVLVSQAGTYSVVVTNAYGMAASSNATLTVTALSITGQPQNQSAFGGATVSFTVSVNGQQPLAYQWLFNDTNLPGATNNPLVLTNVLVSQAGIYSVVVTNAYGMTVSSNATLTVSPFSITQQPTNQITWLNGRAMFKVNVSGTPPFGFDWQCNGADVPGPLTNVLTLTNVQPAQFGIYDVIISNAYGSVVSSNANLLFSQVAVWGGTGGESNLTPGLTNVIAIAGGVPGSTDCLALRGNGTAIHWPATNRVAVSNILAIADSDSSSYLILKTNETLATWFTADDLVETVFGYSNVVAIAPNYYSTLVLMSNGVAIMRGGQAGPPAGTVLSNVVAVTEGGTGSGLSAPSGFGMALAPNGTVTAWGNNTYGQTNVPAGLSNVIAIAAGTYHALALKSNGTVVAWGENNDGQTNVPPGLSNVVAIAAGGYHSLALKRDGTVVAWGLNIYGQTNVPARLTNVIAVAAGEYHSLALIGSSPPILQPFAANPTIGTNGFSLSLPTQSGRVYVLQYKNSLADTTWISLPLAPGNGGQLMLTDPAATNSQRFYRVQQW